MKLHHTRRENIKSRKNRSIIPFVKSWRNITSVAKPYGDVVTVWVFQKFMKVVGALLAGLAVMSELGRDRPAPAVFVEHHHDHAHGPHVYFKGSVDSPQDLASRAFDAGLNAGEHGVGLGHGR